MSGSVEHRIAFDKGSFKDPEGRIAHLGHRVLRVLTPAAADRFQVLLGDGHLDRFFQSRWLLPTTLRDIRDFGVEPPLGYDSRVLEHPRIDMVTYPYEWSFNMLKDAALLTLRLLRACLERGLSLKDATAYNVMPFRGAMVFIDALSIETYREGAPWYAYAQFCREFLFPLMITAYRGLPFQGLLRSSLSGISVIDAGAIFSWATWQHRGVFKHVVIQRLLERQFNGRAIFTPGVGKNLVFSKSGIVGLIDQLEGTVEKLRVGTTGSVWADYEVSHSYAAHDLDTKHAFLARSVSRFQSKRLCDLGCNAGAMSLPLIDQMDLVVGIDSDPACIDRLYLSLRHGADANYYPVVNDLLSPSSSLGWAGRERAALTERVATDTFLALALIHHIAIGGNIPMPMFLKFLTQFGRCGVIEWVDRTDPMVLALLQNRSDSFEDYSWSTFRACIETLFEVHETLELRGGTRTLLAVSVRSPDPLTGRSQTEDGRGCHPPAG